MGNEALLRGAIVGINNGHRWRTYVVAVGVDTTRNVEELASRWLYEPMSIVPESVGQLMQKDMILRLLAVRATRFHIR